MATWFSFSSYNLFLSESDKDSAKAHLRKVWGHLQNLVEADNNNNSGTANQNNNEAAAAQNTSDDEIELMLREKERERHQATLDAARLARITPPEFDALLDAFQNEKRIDRKANILKFWESKKLDNPLLYSVAQVRLALPVTQVSCERSFSGLKYVLSDLRSNLAPSILEDILVIRANARFSQ